MTDNGDFMLEMCKSIRRSCPYLSGNDTNEYREYTEKFNDKYHKLIFTCHKIEEKQKKIDEQKDREKNAELRTYAMLSASVLSMMGMAYLKLYKYP